MSQSDIDVRGLTVGPVESNCYLARVPGGSRAVVIDPGAEPRRIVAALESWGADPTAILLTHGHMDHVGAVADLVREFDVPVHLHPDDRTLYDGAAEHAAAWGLEIDRPPPPDRELEHGRTLREAGIELEVRHAPGHSPGGVVFAGDGHAFVGDCVFAGSVGRVDLPGGDGDVLLSSIRDQILSLEDDTVLWPGHGPRTTVEREARTNPFLAGVHPRGGRAGG